MDPFHGKSSSFDRRSSLRRSLGLLNGGAQDEEEEYDLTAAAVADGFRPTTTTTMATPATPTQSEFTPPQPQSPVPATTPRQPSQSQSPPRVADVSSPKRKQHLADRPSSVSKPPRPHDSLTLRNDGSSQTPSADMPQIRPQSPYQGPSNPSHPYQLYPQRTLSNATNSTAAPVTRRSYDGPRGPTHPYALYTQNIPSGDETAQQAIPVGFAGAQDAYRRQLGPDGEEAGDLIGPLGHTEALPPYSRYPDEPYAPKASGDANQDANPTDALHQPVSGAGGIGVATRNPEFSATEEDLEPSRSRPSTVSQHDINTAARDTAEKPPMNKWQRRAKKKLWGIVPYWAICLLIVALLLMSIIMGAVVGTVLSRHKQSGSGSSNPPVIVTPAPTPPTDVVPLPSVPRGLPPLTTGVFALPPLVASQSPQACFNDTSQSQAWSCNLPYSFYSMDVGPSAAASDTQRYDLSISAINSSEVRFLWGTQPPNIVHPYTLTLVNDTFEPARGPAWWMKITYDKTVLVSQDNFSANAKRWYYSKTTATDSEVIRSTQPGSSIAATEGDMPWICTWPDTSLEIFIYVTQNVSQTQTANPTATVDAVTPSASAKTSPPDDLPVFPNVVKFLERRISEGHPNAYCRQVRIIDNGQGMENVTDSSGQPVVVQIIEKENSWAEQISQRQWDTSPARRGSLYEPLVARSSYQLTECGCLWWATS